MMIDRQRYLIVSEGSKFNGCVCAIVSRYGVGAHVLVLFHPKLGKFSTLYACHTKVLTPINGAAYRTMYNLHKYKIKNLGGDIKRPTIADVVHNSNFINTPKVTQLSIYMVKAICIESIYEANVRHKDPFKHTYKDIATHIQLREFNSEG